MCKLKITLNIKRYFYINDNLMNRLTSNIIFITKQKKKEINEILYFIFSLSRNFLCLYIIINYSIMMFMKINDKLVCDFVKAVSTTIFLNH